MKNEHKILHIMIIIFILFFLDFCRTESVRNEIPALHTEKKKSEMQKSEPGKKEVLSERKELSLEEIFQIALKNSERMNLKKEMIEEADARKDMAFADLFPSLSYRYQKFFNVPDHTQHDSEIRNRNNAYNAYTGAYATPYNPFYTYSQSDGTSSTAVSPAFRPGSRLVLHIPLFSGGTDWNRYKNTDLEVKMRRLEYRNEFYRFYLETAATVFSIMQMEESLESRKKLKSLSKKMSLELQRRSAIGRSRKSEYLNSITRISRIDAEILNIENMLELKREDLVFLTGIKDKISFKKSQSREAEILSADEAEKSVSERYDIQIAKLQMEIANNELKTAYGGHLPSLTLDSYYTFAGKNQTQNRDIFNQLIVQMPLISAGQVSAKVRQAESLKRQAVLRFVQTEKFAVQEVKKAFHHYKNSSLQEKNYSGIVANASRTYGSVMADYDLKQATLLEVLDSLGNLQTAKDELINSKFQKQLDLISLDIAMGKEPVSDSYKEN